MRRLLRDLVSWSLVMLAIALAAGFAWATHNPDHPLLLQAEEWPRVGEWVTRFRGHYGGEVPREPQRMAAGTALEDHRPEHDEPQEPLDLTRFPFAGPSASNPADAPPPETERVWLDRGAELRGRPQPEAPLVAVTPSVERVAVLERRGEWARVRSLAGTGWTVPPAGDEQAPLGSGVVPPRPLPGQDPEPTRLAAALALLPGVEPRALGPYTLYSDASPAVLAYLAPAVEQVEEVYRRRYGVTPVGEAREAVVVFAREEDYRRFQGLERQLGGLPAGGHAGFGLAAVYAGRRGRVDVAATLVHELGHLLNRRALGPALPPWLDEGLADDLAASYIGPDGIDPRRLGGTRVRSGNRVDFHGALSALRHLMRGWREGRVPPLERLVALDWEGFVRSDDRPLHYAQAGMFFRYLLSSGEPELAAGLRRFLARVAAGGPASGEALRHELGRSWQELDTGLRRWVAQQVAATQPGA
ncbi:MAG TPA: hypothetical protein VHQ65_00300 [Thermoanaerobaculia bacterium]|nr:hypothetical protein [Thermoanaerobaculia bacterium]